MQFEILHGDCIDALRAMPDNSIDAIVTDPPYGLSFMGKKWDYDVPSQEVWAECLRVLKPGGHLLAFAGTRTQHRMAVRIEDAGFEIRDLIAWVYGSGFPKSLDVSKAIDKAAGAVRKAVGLSAYASRRPRASAENIAFSSSMGGAATAVITAPATDAARQWQGWGTALKPALEPITVARKPLAGTAAENVMQHGTGAINVDGCRVPGEPWSRPGSNAVGGVYGDYTNDAPHQNDKGRWPANLIHDGEGVADLLGTAARFFYCAKASKKDRDEGLDHLPTVVASVGNMEAAGRDVTNPGNHVGSKRERVEQGLPPTDPRKNHHPTVKPTALMRYLCRLVTPAGGIVLDPFMGSGSTGKAAMLEGFRFIGIEREAEYVNIARGRISHVAANDLKEAA